MNNQVTLGLEGDALLRELQEVLNEEIPLTNAIGVRVGTFQAGRLALTAPLAPNVNHKDTAFAGSLTAVATLTGWSLLWLLLRQHQLDGQIVIQDCSVRYLRPVTADFTAECSLPEAAAVTRFLETFRRRGMARLELHAEIHGAGQLAMELTGRYVVHRKGS